MPEIVPKKNSHCGFCGAAFAPGQPWPRRCAACGNTTYRNPLPVSVVLLPLLQADGGRGLLLVRRTQEPKAGFLALPGGFIELGETWRGAGAREVREETGFEIDPTRITLFDVHSAPDGTVLIFGLAAPASQASLPPFRASSETSEMAVARGPQPLAFPTHEEAAGKFWAGLDGPN